MGEVSLKDLLPNLGVEEYPEYLGELNSSLDEGIYDLGRREVDAAGLGGW